MYAVAVAVYHLCAKNILFYCLNLNLNRKYKKFQLHTILTKKIWILYSNEKLYSYSNSSQKSKILTLAQPIIAQTIIIIIHWCCNYLIFYFCSISSLSIPNLKNIFYSSGALWIISQVGWVVKGARRKDGVRGQVYQNLHLRIRGFESCTWRIILHVHNL